ncbi:MAG: ASPIC/UnbV domain-containing protein [Terriglobales bacterium]
MCVDEVRRGSSYNSPNNLRLYFGLGFEARINSIEVRWPSSQTESFPVHGIDQYLTFTEVTGKASP